MKTPRLCGESWYIQRPGESIIREVYVEGVTKATVLLRYPGYLERVRYVTAQVNWIEQINPLKGDT